MPRSSRAAGPAFTAIDHVDVKVVDLASARRFFESLGLEVMSESDDHVFLLAGDQVVGLRRVDRGTARDGVDHLALRVASPEAADGALTAAGLTPSRTRRRKDSYSWFLEGPEGLPVELVHRPDPGHHGCKNPPGHPRAKARAKP